MNGVRTYTAFIANFFWKPGPQEVFTADETWRSSTFSYSFYLCLVSIRIIKRELIWSTPLFHLPFLSYFCLHELHSLLFGIFQTGCRTP
jgi:hypothetical protein